jgi:hypothetical protein
MTTEAPEEIVTEEETATEGNVEKEATEENVVQNQEERTKIWFDFSSTLVKKTN